MKKNILFLLLIIFIIILSLNVYAKQDHIYLLTAEVSANSTAGGVADLYLEIKPGQGRVFFQSYPLTQVDTQISTRFAKEFACDFLDINCNNIDFFYTISSAGPIVGGPSAGASMTVLTIAMLDNKAVNQDIVMTGTINSGGIIGPVGAVKEKVIAAERHGFQTAIIPKWTKFEEDNQTNFIMISNDTEEEQNPIDLIIKEEDTREEFLSEDNYYNSIKVLRIYDIIDALYYFTGKNYSDSKEFDIPEEYVNTMSSFSIMLCNKTNLLMNNLDISFDDYDYEKEFNITVENNSTNKTQEEKEQELLLKAYVQYNNSKIASNQEKTYSAASFCFSTNVLFREIQFLRQNDTLELELNNTIIRLDNLKSKTNNINVNSMIKLQTKQIVLERVLEAENYLIELKKDLNPADLAYFTERVYSAEIWSNFFNIESKEQVIDQSILKKVCRLKIMEAQERIAYLETIFPIDFDSLDDKLDTASKLSREGNYELCIFVAAQTKAKANLVITNAYLYDTDLEEFVADKIILIRNILAKEMSKDIFPIASLSYLEYAESLKDVDIYSAMLYLEYASEFGKLSMYFSDEKIMTQLDFYINDPAFIITSLIFGAVISGLIISMFSIISLLQRKFKKKNKHKKQ